MSPVLTSPSTPLPSRRTYAKRPHSELPVPPSSPTASYTSKSTSDSDDSPAYIHVNRAYIDPQMSCSIATIEHAMTKHCPILTGGDTTPQTLLILENTFNEFFIAKNISQEDQVKLILGAFTCVHIWDWIATDREHILTLTFDKFMTQLCKNLLPSDW